MILFIHHDAISLFTVDRDAAAPLRLGHFTANELSFHEKLSIEFLQLLHVEIVERSDFLDPQKCVANLPFGAGSILVGAAADKRSIGNVSREVECAC